MAADRLPNVVREFANYLDGLLARLDPSGGWCAVFWQRDPDGMRACLDGREMPPWDVVEALLQDLAGQYGPGGAGPETERARALHAAALTAYDARPGGRDALGDRLDVMLREQKYAAERQADLSRRLVSAPTREQADALRLDLAWARDDHERATARCAELRARMADLDRREALRAVRGAGAGAADGDGGVRGDAPGAPGGGASAGTADGRGGGASADGGRLYGGAGAVGGAHAFAGDSAEGGGRASADGGAAGDRARPDGGAAADSGQQAWGRVYAGDGPGSGGGGAGSGSGGAFEAGRRAGGGVYAGDGPGPGDGGRGSASGRQAWSGLHTGDGPGPGGGGAGSDSHEPYDAKRPATSWYRTEAAPAVADAAGSREARGEAAAPHQEGREGGAAHQGALTGGMPDTFTAPAPKQRKRRRGSARVAGLEVEAAPVVLPPGAGPAVPGAARATGRTRRGARFAGVAEEAVVAQAGPQAEAPGALDRGEVARTVEMLARMRGEGRSGEAHALLAEAASWAPARFPLLADELHRAGLGADWQTLLWEAASLPADRLVAAADALTAAGRTDDGQQILRQGVARPPGEVGRAVLALVAEGRHREVRALLDAYVSARTPEEAARSAEPDPQRLVPLLLQAARGVSDERCWDLVHALRVAGFTA